jgi:hypothetical protein
LLIYLFQFAHVPVCRGGSVCLWKYAYERSPSSWQSVLDCSGTTSEWKYIYFWLVIASKSSGCWSS